MVTFSVVQRIPSFRVGDQACISIWGMKKNDRNMKGRRDITITFSLSLCFWQMMESIEGWKWKYFPWKIVRTKRAIRAIREVAKLGLFQLMSWQASSYLILAFSPFPRAYYGTSMPLTLLFAHASQKSSQCCIVIKTFKLQHSLRFLALSSSTQ